MDIPFELQTGQAVGITRHVLNQLISLKDAMTALLFCYLLANPEALDINRASFTLGTDSSEIMRAFNKLKEAGLINPAMEFASGNIHTVKAVSEIKPVQNEERPIYTSQQISAALQSTSDFRAVVKETETRLGKVLAANDLQILYGIYDWRGLPAGVLNMLITHCIEQARKRYGPGRPPTLKQIDREAAIWESEGVDTDERAEEYLTKLAQRKVRRNQILSVLQIRGREPSVTEQRYINEWDISGQSIELISQAYDKTVIQTGKMSWKYMDTILKNWKDQNVTTVDDLEKAVSSPVRALKPPSSQPVRSRITNESRVGERERAAVNDMRDYIRRLRDQEEC